MDNVLAGGVLVLTIVFITAAILSDDMLTAIINRIKGE
jgi:hypothetical protein